MGLGTLMMLGMLWTPGQAPPAAVIPYNQAKLDIPIRYDPVLKNTIRELQLLVSQNQGQSWDKYAVANPDKDSFFTFTAPADGVYWFQMVTIDKKGQASNADSAKAPPPLKVLIDTKPPVITIRSLDRTGDDATVTWDVQETNPDWNRFQLEYRVGEGSWTSVDAHGAAQGSAKFHVSQPGPLSVRIQTCDAVGNRAEAMKDFAAAPPTVVASSPAPIQPAAMRVNFPNPSDAIPPIDPVSPIPPPVDPPLGVTKNVDESPAAPPPAPAGVKTDGASPLAVSPNATHTAGGMPLPATQIINVARFDLAYEVEQKGPSGISKAEVWVTRDDGKTWQKWSETEKAESSVTVELATRNNPQVEGVYGLKIVLLSGAGLSKGPPISGDVPDMRIDVDLTPPVVKIYEPIPDPNQKDSLILRWQAVDRNLANDPITLEWAEQQDGPWNPIVGEDSGAPLNASTPAQAKRLPNSGQYSWHLPANFPTHRVYLRVTARDVAGNVGEVRSPHPILVDMNKPVARIHGIIGSSLPDHR